MIVFMQVAKATASSAAASASRAAATKSGDTLVHVVSYEHVVLQHKKQMCMHVNVGPLAF